MGARKRKSSEALKEQNKDRSFAVLNNLRMSPRKVRLVADQIRGMNVNQALNILHFSPKYASNNIEKLLFSAIANWQNKNAQKQLEESELFVKEVFVNQGRSLKRIQPAPQGRAHRILKRSCHVTLVVDTINKKVEEIGEEIIDTKVTEDSKKDNDNKKTNKK